MSKAVPDTETDTPPMPMPDPIQLTHILIDVYERSQPLLKDYIERHGFEFTEQNLDPLNLRDAGISFMSHLFANPNRLLEMQMRYWNEWSNLWQASTTRFMGGESLELYKPEQGDKRFSSPVWNSSTFYDFIKQSYLMNARWMEDIVSTAEDLDDDTRQRVMFQTRQLINALAPTNFLLTNPEVLSETLRTGGENLIRGLKNLLEDLERGHGELAIRTTDYDAFKLGENIATTKGSVIYRNDLIELIQYEPQTETVHETPLLIIPPWINKYYILDLRPDNSFVAWATAQGYTVFTISWVNPNRKLAQKRFEDYMTEGVLEALTQVEKATGVKGCNTVGYCLGGTLQSVTLAYLAAMHQSERISSATFFTSLVDFEKAGELKMFMDESQLMLLDKEMTEKGVLPAAHMKKTFSMLRANDLVWSFVINNYLLGKEPFPFDLLYWNDDSTNMPAAMHSFYMRYCYARNLLPRPGGVTMAGTPIDMTKVETPAYFLSTRDDHIAPWKATYATTQLFEGERTFVLSASGHVAGVVNPPHKKKYCYWTNPDLPDDPDSWHANVEQHEGSWWPHWEQWLRTRSGKKIPARTPKNALCDAPGTYVRLKPDV